MLDFLRKTLLLALSFSTDLVVGGSIASDGDRDLQEGMLKVKAPHFVSPLEQSKKLEQLTTAPKKFSHVSILFGELNSSVAVVRETLVSIMSEDRKEPDKSAVLARVY